MQDIPWCWPTQQEILNTSIKYCKSAKLPWNHNLTSHKNIKDGPLSDQTTVVGQSFQMKNRAGHLSSEASSLVNCGSSWSSCGVFTDFCESHGLFVDFPPTVVATVKPFSFTPRGPRSRRAQLPARAYATSSDYRQGGFWSVGLVLEICPPVKARVSLDGTLLAPICIVSTWE